MVYFFGRNQGATEQWGKTASLPQTPSGKYDNYGGSVALSGNTALVGASAAYGTIPVYGTIPGAAHLFQRGVSETNSWTEVQVLVGSDTAQSDGFGASVATDGQTMVVGAPLHDASTGAAYVFMSTPQRPLIMTYALSANGFRLNLHGKPGFGYRIQASQDLVSWTGIGVSLADTNGFFSFTDQDASILASRAYRVTER